MVSLHKLNEYHNAMQEVTQYMEWDICDLLEAIELSIAPSPVVAERLAFTSKSVLLDMAQDQELSWDAVIRETYRRVFFTPEGLLGLGFGELSDAEYHSFIQDVIQQMSGPPRDSDTPLH